MNTDRRQRKKSLRVLIALVGIGLLSVGCLSDPSQVGVSNQDNAGEYDDAGTDDVGDVNGEDEGDDDDAGNDTEDTDSEPVTCSDHFDAQRDWEDDATFRLEEDEIDIGSYNFAELEVRLLGGGLDSSKLAIYALDDIDEALQESGQSCQLDITGDTTVNRRQYFNIDSIDKEGIYCAVLSGEWQDGISGPGTNSIQGVVEFEVVDGGAMISCADLPCEHEDCD